MSVHDHASFLKRLVESDYRFGTIFDVGANIGSWTCEAQKVVPHARFEMFEPLVGRNADLDAAARFEQVRNGSLHAVALSDRNGEQQMKVLGARGVGSSILLLDSDYRKDTTFATVPAWTMDDFVQANGLPKPDFIKLDTQASELQILAGARQCLETCQFVLAETWMRRVYGPATPLFHELANFMYQANFCLFEILSLEEGRDNDGTLRWFDAVFINKRFSRFAAHLL